MKYLTLLLLFSSLFLNAQTNDDSYNELLKKSPFNEMYPKYMAQGAADYFTVFNSGSGGSAYGKFSGYKLIE